MSTVKDRLTWFQAFMPLYRRATPLIQRMTSLELPEQRELPMLAASGLILRPILDSVRNLPKPEQKELRNLHHDFETALSSSVRAGEWAAKQILSQERGSKDEIEISSIANSIVLAREYIESASRKLSSPLRS